MSATLRNDDPLVERHHRRSFVPNENFRLGQASYIFSLCMTLTCLAVGCSGLSPGPGAADPDAPQEFTTTNSGLKYRILRKSDGKKPTSSGHVRVHYQGKLEDGTIFDSSYSRGKPAIFGLDAVVAGWSEGMRFVGEGGMIELVIPPELGYGEEGRAPDIPPNATLTFVVELIRVF